MSLRGLPRRFARVQSWILVGGLLGLVSACAADEVQGPWDTGTEWFTVQGGYAKSTAEGAPDGNVGMGFAYTRFHNSKWSFGGTVLWNTLGRFGSARELEVPWTFDLTRHYKWPAEIRPFVGFGLGAYYHQISGTTQDASAVVAGGYVGSGFNATVSDHGLLGLNVRMNVVGVRDQRNPVFGGEVTANQHQSQALHWNALLGYSWVF